MGSIVARPDRRQRAGDAAAGVADDRLHLQERRAGVLAQEGDVRQPQRHGPDSRLLQGGAGRAHRAGAGPAPALRLTGPRRCRTSRGCSPGRRPLGLTRRWAWPTSRATS
ncbi:MAG: hypothetical protein MZV70_19595 [Desulfobacterales bacterium]|nr:hypothetical protein [Desulfobacterales bacterium]